ncbi:ankyrin repeat domain-containing protein 33B-like [Liolophura sinensis]|uniref:ankyrin repeat domain-containing protein 33B-like n=1 Tax=Liolophura sinensis TaxID=3198878 RepID=UPI0031581273
MHQDIDDDSSTSSDSQYTASGDDITILDACIECDIEALHVLLEDCPQYEEVNEVDRSGRTGLSHACANGFTPAVEALSEVPEVDVNQADSEGNSPLIFAAQAGHTDVVRLLLNNFKKVRVDQANRLGFTPLLKAAIQGRTSCAKLLLFAGASPKIRDPGRHLCAEEWARFCGRHDCADAIAKLSHTRSFFSKPKFRTLREKSCSVPDLSQAEDCKPAASDKSSKDDSQHSSNGRTKGIGKAFRKIFHWENESGNGLCTDQSPFAIVARCVSTPLLPEILNFSSSPPLRRRPLSIEHLSAIPKVEVTTPAGVLDQPDYNNTSPARRRRKQTSGGCKHCDVLSK